MESLVLHHDCLTALCERKMAAGQIIKTDPEKTLSAKVIRFPGSWEEAGCGTCDP
ncbi:hypothetical protein [Nocardia terrae]|nr:hypothetical protein [Nocardia terrae]